LWLGEEGQLWLGEEGQLWLGQRLEAAFFTVNDFKLIFKAERRANPVFWSSSYESSGWLSVLRRWAYSTGLW
jgi:hypothetical protein